MKGANLHFDLDLLVQTSWWEDLVVELYVSDLYHASVQV